MSFRKVYNHLCMYIEEIILAIIIILNLLDAIKVLPPSLDYAKKIISWGVLGYLLYHASLTKLLFGIQNKKIDLFLVISYFLLIFNKFTSYAKVALEELHEHAYEMLNFSQASTGPNALQVTVQNVDAITTADFTQTILSQILEKLTFLNPAVLLEVTDGTQTIYLNASTQHFSITHFFSYINGSLFYLIKFLADNAAMLEKFAFLIGGIALIVLALYWAFTKQISAPSLMHVIHEDKKSKTFFQKLFRSLVIYIVLVAFFIAVFNLIMEWLAVAIDAYIVVVLVLLYIYWVFKGHKKFKTEHFITKVGSGSEKFYEKFVELFHTKHGIFLGIAGILVLHLLTDIGIFILPYILFPQDPLYFHQDPMYFSADHNPLSVLFMQDYTLTQNIGEIAALSYNYIFSSIGIIMLFLIPAYIWHTIFKGRKGHANRVLLSLFFMGLICHVFTPLFKIKSLETPYLVGVDITTSSVIPNLTLPLSLVAGISVVVGIVFYFLTKNTFLRREMTYGAVIIGMIYLGKYIYYFFLDNIIYYLDAIHAFVATNSCFFAFYFLMFFGIVIVFYTAGFIMFVYEIIKYFRMSKEG